MIRDNDKSWLLLICLLLRVTIYSGCQARFNRKISDKELTVISTSCSKQVYPISLLYLDGDCSFCLAKALAFEEKVYGKGNGSVLLFKVSNPVMAKMYIQGLSLRSCIILDSSNLFAHSFALNSMYEITGKGEILSEKLDK